MKKTNLDRRAFLRGKSPKTYPKANRPPWTIEASNFIDQCERCDECLKACPENIIIKGDGGYPEIDFKLGSCTFCKECLSICKYDAFIDNENCNKDNAWEAKIIIKQNCLSLNSIVCRICGENCEEDAIQFRLQLKAKSIPIIDHDLCSGCGECLYVCPENSISLQNSKY